MDAKKAFASKDAKQTILFQDRLISRGHAGQVAFGLFRASKRSQRAKSYRRGMRASAYDAKSNALQHLDSALSRWGQELGIEWGWNIDPSQPVHRFVLYVDLPKHGQASFHAGKAESETVYRKDWSGKRDSAEVVLAYCQEVLDSPEGRRELTGEDLVPFGKHVGKPLEGLDRNYLEWLTHWEGISDWPAFDSWIRMELGLPNGVKTGVVG
ncbi:MAG: hypothetical protein ABI557_11705 [Aureliella sp.]